MQTDTFTFRTDDGSDIFTYGWLPDPETPIKAVVQIAHGMAEHAGRYGRFAGALNAAGYAVYANDHRGHGRTAEDLTRIGYFADQDGWFKVAGDLMQLTDIIRKKHPAKPVFLLGHSMGSFLVRTVITRNAGAIAGVVLSGTGGDPGLLGKVGLVLARAVATLKGRRHPSGLLNALSFGGFNKPFAPARTEFDWLSRDSVEVDRYIADPFCGAVFSAGFFADLLTGMAFIHRPENIARIPKDLPIYLFSGAADPVSDRTRGVRQVAEAYRRAGIRDVTLRCYEGGRHEMLNEINRREVFDDTIAWLDGHTAVDGRVANATVRGEKDSAKSGEQLCEKCLRIADIDSIFAFFTFEMQDELHCGDGVAAMKMHQSLGGRRVRSLGFDQQFRPAVAHQAKINFFAVLGSQVMQRARLAAQIGLGMDLLEQAEGRQVFKPRPFVAADQTGIEKIDFRLLED
jgi:alpha-beta hydrolase superfamily lysophospholipase